MTRHVGKAAEEPAAAAFAQYLRRTHQAQGIGWKKGSDPPDLVMSHGESSVAVEVTSLIESVPLGGSSPRNLRESTALHHALVKAIEEEVLAAGILDGAYSVCFGYSVVGRRELEPVVREHVIRYVSETQAEEKAPPKSHAVPGSSRTLLWIVKHHTKYPRLAPAAPPQSAFGGECRAEAERLLAERISSKVTRFAGVSAPRVLLLWDATCLLDEEHFLGATHRAEWLESIEAAYLVRDADRVYELWSSIVEW